MTGAWVGRKRCLSLWRTINEYVTTYVNINNTPSDEAWYIRWRDLIDKHNILEKRDFDFLAYVIVGRPDATVLDCIHTLTSFIPNLSEHITIILTNSKGNVQYSFTPLAPNANPSTLTNRNQFSSLQEDTDSDSSEETVPPHTSPELTSKPSPTPSDFIQSGITRSPTQKPTTTPTKVYQSALDTATSTLNVISDFSKDIDPSVLRDMDQIHDTMLHLIKNSCDEQINSHRATMKVLYDEYFNDFCRKCDEHCNNLADDFDNAMNHKIHSYESKIKQFELKINDLEKKLSSATKSFKPSSTRSSFSHNKTNNSPKQTHSFGPTKSFQSSDPNTNTIQQYFHKTSLEFWHQADKYYLLDKDYLKNSPRLEPPNNVNDALSIYSQIQKNALIYNIFVTPIDHVKIWDYAPNSVPTTCNLDVDDEATFRQVYQRSAVALYTKIQTMDMKQVPIFKQLIIHERNSQDGYKVLYAMLCGCHPRLVEKSKIEPPKFDQNGNLFTFIREYSNYIECERISSRSYTDIEKLSFVIEALEADGRFEKALGSIKMRKNAHEEMVQINSKSVFPPALTLETLPYTIMQCYTPKEKSEFFSTSSTTVPTIQAITQRQPSQQRQRSSNQTRQVTNTICRSCGIAGHDVGSTGCDFATSFIMTNAYLRNNSNNKQFILSQFKQHQQNRLTNLNSRKSLSNRIQNKAQNKRIGLSPQMRLLVDAIGEEIESELNETSSECEDNANILSVYDLPPDSTTDEFHDTTDAGTEVIPE